jgi:glycosyltransferase involved in cell wall biosynthesis
VKPLLIISTHFPPESGAGTHRIIRFTKHLRAFGREISVLTMHPEYYADSRLDETLLTQIPKDIAIYRTKVLRGMTALISLRNSLKRKKVDVMKLRASIQTIPAAPAESVSRWQQVKDTATDLFSLPDGDIGWLWYAVRQGIRIIRQRQIGVIFSSAPPFTCHLVAAVLRRYCNVKWVADFRDPWSRAPWVQEEMTHSWKGYVHRWLEQQTIQRADVVLLNTQPMSEEFAKYYGPSTAQKFYTIPNGYDAEVLAPYQNISPRPRNTDTLIVTHAGSLYRERNPVPLLQALASAIQHQRIPPQGVELHFVGALAKRFSTVAEVIKKLHLESVVRFTPPVSHKESLDYLSQSDVLLVVQPGTHLQVPVKLYEYMALQKPILALTPPGAVADIMTQGRLGLVASPEDSTAIEEIVCIFYEHRHHLQEVFPIDTTYIQQFDGKALSWRLHEILEKI